MHIFLKLMCFMSFHMRVFREVSITLVYNHPAPLMSERKSPQ